MKKKFICIISAIIFLIINSSIASYAASLEISPQNITLPPTGDQFDIQVLISDVTGLGAFQFNIRYNPSIVTISDNNHVRLGDFLDQSEGTVSPLGPSIDNNTGKVTFGAFTIGADKGAEGTGTLATITFTVQTASKGTLEMNNDDVQLSKTDGSVIPVNSVNGANLLVEGLNFTVNFSISGQGTITGNMSQIVNKDENTSTVTAVPDSSYRFTGWTGDYTSTDNPLTIKNITSDMNVVANFEPVPTYNVNFKIQGNGIIQGQTEQTVEQGMNTTQVIATPNQGSHFTGWTGDYTGSDNPLIIANVTKDMNITANFDINIYTVTFSADSDGSLKGETTQEVQHGNNCTPYKLYPQKAMSSSVGQTTVSPVQTGCSLFMTTINP
ncbi:MAG: hypothetical protein GY795_42845 [Desulfobacterales bacterium]|nr:hypothetical protein [Desulfobacterales bacterium]